MDRSSSPPAGVDRAPAGAVVLLITATILAALLLAVVIPGFVPSGRALAAPPSPTPSPSPTATPRTSPSPTPSPTPSPATATSQTTSAPTTAPEPGSVEEAEASFRDLMNAERSGHGVRQLRMRRKLVALARQHSERMASSNGIYHNPRLAKSLRGLRWRMAGENVGVGNTPDSLHRAFMNSPPHRENVLRPQFNRVGVGVVYARDRLWVTVVFVA